MTLPLCLLLAALVWLCSLLILPLALPLARVRQGLLALLALLLAVALSEHPPLGPELGNGWSPVLLAPVAVAGSMLACFYTPAFNASTRLYAGMLGLHFLLQLLLHMPDPLLLACSLPAAFALLLWNQWRTPGQRRLLLAYGLPVCILTAVLLLAGNSPVLQLLALPLLLGQFPLAAWYPRLFEQAPPGLLAQLLMFQVGCVLTLATLLTPQPLLLPLLTLGSLLSLLMALAQAKPRRSLAGISAAQLGFLFFAVSATTQQAAALVLAKSMLLTLPGLILTLGMLEMRRGPLSLLRPMGHYDSYPKLATAILLFGLMAAGFPLTLAYVAEDVVLAAGFEAHPLLVGSWLLMLALNAIALVKHYLYLCHGERGHEPGIDILPGKLLASAATVLYLLVSSILVAT